MSRSICSVQLSNNLRSPQLEAQFIFTGANRHSEKDLRSYLQYLEYLNQNRPAPNAYELFAKGYEDYLQSPLQVCLSKNKALLSAQNIDYFGFHCTNVMPNCFISL